MLDPISLFRAGAVKKSGRIPRTTRLLSSSRIRPRNDKRRKSEFARAYHSEERVLWVQALPSVVSGETPCVNAHVRNGGAGRKADYRWIVPLTDQEHQNYHVVGKRFFEKWAKVDLDAAAADVERRWQQEQSDTGDAE